jgi:hypothetical protein
MINKTDPDVRHMRRCGSGLHQGPSATFAPGHPVLSRAVIIGEANVPSAEDLPHTVKIPSYGMCLGIRTRSRCGLSNTVVVLRMPSETLDARSKTWSESQPISFSHQLDTHSNHRFRNSPFKIPHRRINRVSLQCAKQCKYLPNKTFPNPFEEAESAPTLCTL